MVKVYEITGQVAIRKNLAEHLNAILTVELIANVAPVIVDFSGVDHSLALFLHVAIGRLYNRFPALILDRKLQVINMSTNVDGVYSYCREFWDC